MKNNVEYLRQQINLLKIQYKTCKNEEDAKIILASFNNLLDLYYRVTDNPFLKIKNVGFNNLYYYQIYTRYNNQIKKEFYNNFFKYKDFHYNFICKIINEFPFLEYKVKQSDLPNYIPSHSKKELNYLFKSFCHEQKEHLYEIYKDLRKNNHIFVSRDNLDFYAYATADYKNNKYFVLFDNSDVNIGSLVTLVHEIGHIEDYYNLNSSEYVSYLIRIYREVNSFFREKEFWDYLLKNKIYLNEIKTHVLLETGTILEYLINLIIYSKMPKKYFNKEKITEKYLNESFSNIHSEKIRDIFFDYDHLYPFIDSVIYSYGELLGTYFLDNKDKYMAFCSKQTPFFNPNLLKELDITSTDIVKSLYKRYEKY